MGVWNNLRKRIVHRLIKPDEDGYIPTGYATRLYRERDSYQYGMERVTYAGTNYYKPTLTGWATAVAGNDLEQVEFTEWVFGILSNLYAEYSHRLENITLKELKQFKKQKRMGKIVISKKSFCDIMNALDNYWDNLRDLENVLDVMFEDNMFTDILDGVVDALVEEMEPERDFFETPVINRWLFEWSCGRDEKAKEGIDGHPLTNAEELYDYLIHKKNLQETLDKFENM